MSIDRFESDRQAMDIKIKTFLDILERENVSTRSMIGAFIIESDDKGMRQQHVFGMQSGRADLTTAFDTAANLLRHCCKLLCIIAGKDPDSPQDMKEAYGMIMGYFHQRGQDIIGQEQSSLILQ